MKILFIGDIVGRSGRESVVKGLPNLKTKFNNLKDNDWDNILNHEWFSSALEESWDTNLDGGKLMRCSRTCGN